VRSAGFGSAPFDVTLLRDNAPPVHAAVYFVGEGFFDLFGLPIPLGSGFTHERHVPTGRGAGPPPVTVLSHRAWTEMFGGDPQIVGKTVRFAELTATVTGVAARDLDVPHGADFWMNARLDPQDVGHVPATIFTSAFGTAVPIAASVILPLSVYVAGIRSLLAT